MNRWYNHKHILGADMLPKVNKILMGCALIAYGLIAIVPGLAEAQSGFIAQGFKSDDSGLSAGALVSLKEDSPDTVELSNIQRAERLVGVVSEQAFLEVTDAASTVEVVLDGSTPTLVSDINGDIKAGDNIAVSPIAGVGMKATQSAVVVGIAQTDFADIDTVERAVDDQNGRPRIVKVGLLSVQINVAAYITQDKGDSSGVPSFLQNAANTVAGRAVSPVRVILATAITILLFGVISVVLYSSVRSSIISIGRNPLSERSLRKSLAQVGLIILGVAIVGLGIVYAVLRI